MFNIKEFILFAVLLTCIDAAYLSSISTFFNKQVKDIQGTDIKLNPLSTVLCYILLVSGLYYFAIMKNFTLLDTFILGIFVYGVYELTNHAIFKKWRWDTVGLDTIWGGILFTISVMIFKKIRNKI
jgi:uncharacterized membrane protein